MDVIEAINNRRSIRKFRPDPLPDEAIRTILQAGIHAPSGKNKQPWKFVVVKEDKRDEMIKAMAQGIKNSKAANINIGSAEYTLRIMAEAPVTIFVFNPYGKHPWDTKTTLEQILETVDVQSVGAAIQNMLLAATHLGIGSLWICDVFFAYEELCTWLQKDCQMIAAVSFGYTDEKPAMRPRKSIEQVVEWK